MLRQIFRVLTTQLAPTTQNLTNAVRDKTPCGVETEAPLTYDETVVQMSRGYENTQRVVQFMDAKAAAVITLCLGIFVLTGKLLVGLHARLGEGMLISHEPPLCFMIWFMTALTCSAGIAGFISLHFAFRAVRPNGLPKPEHFSTLFPAGKKAYENPVLISYMEKVVGGQNRFFVLDEFRRQLLAMGAIVHLKIESLRWSIRALWWQGFFGFALVISIGLISGLGLYPPKAELPQKPLPVTIVPS